MAELASDAILLERFAKGREEAAFVVLVKRHGPLVERICRRILRNEQDVEDVFQATFLILARKAAFISWQDSVSGWLTAVAHRLAMHARSGAARQRVQEISISVLAGKANDIDGRLPEKYHPLSDPSPEIERRDLRRLLDDELSNLPEKYRAPVVLCYLEGWTHEEAAQQLGWPTGSMSRRLDRARALLRRRLARRGLALAIIFVISATLVSIGFDARPAVLGPRRPCAKRCYRSGPTGMAVKIWPSFWPRSPKRTHVWRLTGRLRGSPDKPA